MEQSQKVVLTAELKQAIEILQYSTLELEQHIHEELMNNPVLELYSVENKPLDLSRVLTPSATSNQSYSDEEIPTYDIPDQENDLLRQIHHLPLFKKEQQIAEYLAENLDHRGMLTTSIKEVATLFQCDTDHIHSIILQLQTLEPTGIFALDITNYLQLLLRSKGISEQSTEMMIINDHLHCIAENKITQIAKALNVSPKEVQRACDTIKSINPSMLNENESINYLTPDIQVLPTREIIIADRTAPILKINNYYRDLFNHSDIGTETTAYLSKKLNAAFRLIKAIEQRRITLYKVCESIVNKQSNFFDQGVKGLKPLTMKEVADDIEMHESTVSRATSGMYLQCKHGLFNMKYFFQSGIPGQDISAGTIKMHIRQLIDAENPQNPLSDQEISNHLKKQGILASRRTIAKYRDAANILPSKKRKRY